MEQQITQLLDRVRPVAARVRELVDSGEASAGLTLIRHFDDDRGIPEALGWWLEPKQVELLAAMSASIQSDEYGG